MLVQRYRILVSVLAVVIDLHFCVETEGQSATATISPRGGYNASLDPNTSTTLQCLVTGADSIVWVVDGVAAGTTKIYDRGIMISDMVTIDEAKGRFASNLSIPRTRENKNTAIHCIANSFTSRDIPSSVAYFQVQCLLSEPPGLNISASPNHRHMRILTWNEPETIDITDVDPDISHYRVCYNISGEFSSCEITSERHYLLADVSVDIVFSVAAVNVVGIGNESTILHKSCNQEPLSGKLT